MDYILLGCDGIYDKLSTSEIGKIAWETIEEHYEAMPPHMLCGIAVDNVLKASVGK